MKRGPMLYCAAMDAPRYKVLNVRGQTAFADIDDETPLGGNAFTLDHSFRLRFLQDLIGGEGDDETQLGGLSASYAAKLVLNVVPRFPLHPLNHFGPLDWWAGVAVFQDESGEGDHFRYSSFYVGEIEQLAAWIEEKRQRSPPQEGRCEVARVFVANATRAARFVRDRAQELGLPEASDFNPVEPR